MNKSYFVYMLVNTRNTTYIGMTNNPRRRVRQHNGIIKGGARATRRSNTWWMFTVVGMFTKIEALKFERAWKKKSHGVVGRLKRLWKLLLEEKYKDVNVIPRSHYA